MWNELVWFLLFSIKCIILKKKILFIILCALVLCNKKRQILKFRDPKTHTIIIQKKEEENYCIYKMTQSLYPRSHSHYREKKWPKKWLRHTHCRKITPNQKDWKIILEMKKKQSSEVLSILFVMW